MAGLRGISDDALEALAALMAPGEIVGIFSPEPITEARALAVITHKLIHQMTYEGHNSSPYSRAPNRAYTG